ncbi:hypothetical protein BBG47_20625 [Paenibacillus sp. KS1]|nr:hypothetical protein BBG47_20625 [Paenibacillus sp. KS1]
MGVTEPITVRKLDMLLITEAMTQVLNFGFNELDINRIGQDVWLKILAQGGITPSMNRVLRPNNNILSVRAIVLQI